MTDPSRDSLLKALPYARRFARALTGRQEQGDRLVADSLREILASANPVGDPRLALYRSLTRLAEQADGGETPGLSRQQRQLLLLTSLEELPIDSAAGIVGIAANEAVALLNDARGKLREAAAAEVLIIEDEPIIAMDIEELVASCGHRVLGIAATEQEAVDLAAKHNPGLILADINLGAGGDGSTAVGRILQHCAAPVIFVTAYPERLLTGEALEPAFVITKPFEPMMLAVATYQAVTGGVKLDLGESNT